MIMSDSTKIRTNDSKDKLAVVESTDIATTSNTRSVVIAAILAVIMLLIGFGGGFLIGRHSVKKTITQAASRFGNQGTQDPMGLGGRFGAQRRGEALGNMGNRLNGVVTAVNGSSFTLAGQGTTKTIQTSGTTVYSGGSTVKVNDSVNVVYSGSGDTLTATRVTILNNQIDSPTITQ